MMSRKLASQTKVFRATEAGSGKPRPDFDVGSRAPQGDLRITEPADMRSAGVNLNAPYSVDVTPPWGRDLVLMHPNLFPSLSQGTGIHSVPQCGTGWSGIVERLCMRIDAVLTERERFRFEQIKEHNGMLRVYWSGRLSARSEAHVRGAIDLAEARSQCFCDLCGAEGRLYRDGAVFATRCGHHAKGERIPVRPELHNHHLTQKMTIGRQWTVVIRRYDPQVDAFVDPDPADTDEC
jgi:hypothetical protein